MDTSLIRYLNETAADLLTEAETGFPGLADELYREAAALMNLAAKLSEARGRKHDQVYSQAA